MATTDCSEGPSCATCAARVATPTVIAGCRPLLAVPIVRSRSSSPVRSVDPPIGILRNDFRGVVSKPCRSVRVSWAEDDERVEFRPHAVPRLDVDVTQWLTLDGTSTARRSQTKKLATSEWKMEPGRDMSHMDYHFSLSVPSPRSYIKRCECIALRNARESAEHLEYRDFSFLDNWPTDESRKMYLPKFDH